MPVNIMIVIMSMTVTLELFLFGTARFLGLPGWLWVGCMFLAGVSWMIVLRMLWQARRRRG